MAPVPARQPRLRLPRARAGARATGVRGLIPARLRRLIPPAAALACAVAAYAAIHRLGVDDGVAVSRAGKAVHPALRIGAACVLLFGTTGLGVTRVALPASLRRHEPLWILPVGAGASALALAVLGYAGSPFKVSLALVLIAAGALDVVVIRRRGLIPPGVGWRHHAWPVYVAGLLAFLALVPLMHADFDTVTGTGADAHLAVGTAVFLQHHYPTSFHVGGPVDEVPLEWRSKTPIYYAFAAVSSLAGYPPFRVLATLQAVLLVLLLIGIFLLAREVLGTGAAAAAIAMGLVGLDQMVLHTILHPYYNQTWGMVALPYAIVAAWWCAGPRRVRTRGTIGLLIASLAVCAFAYPLAVPFPLLALAVFWWMERRARRARGETVRPLSLRGLRRRHWTRMLAGIALLAALAVPLYGVGEKLGTGWNVIVDPLLSLKTWGGDLGGYFPEHEFFSLPSTTLLEAGLPVMALGCWVALREKPRSLRWGMVAMFLAGALGAVWFRARAHGYYFEFKILCFAAPLLIATAAAGLWRLRLLGWGLLAAWLVLALPGARNEVDNTPVQLAASIIDLLHLNATLPARESIRLDMDPPLQLWVAEMLSSHPLCSQTPVLNTAYPHVPVGRQADYVLVDYQLYRPFDAIGPPLRRIGTEFRLYRESPATPGPDTCSRRRVQTVTAIIGG